MFTLQIYPQSDTFACTEYWRFADLLWWREAERLRGPGPLLVGRGRLEISYFGTVWRCIKDYEGLWRIMKERGYHVHVFRGLVSLSAGCCQHLQLPPGSSRKCGTSKADGTAEEANSILSVSCQCLATWELGQWDQYNSQKSCGLLANSQPWTGVFWNVASCMWTCWSNTSGNHPGLLSTFQRWSTFCCGLTCSFPPRKRTEWFARLLRVATDQSTNLQVCRDSDKVDGRCTWHEVPV